MVLLAFAESVQILPDFALVVHIVIILAMIWVLNKTFFSPINRVIAAREKSEGGQMTETEEMLIEAAEKEAQHKEELLNARNEGYRLIEVERASAVEARQQKIANSKEETAAKLEQDLEELSKQTEATKATLAKEAGKLADEISSNILNAA